MKVSWDYDIPNIWKNKKCSKPPTSNGNLEKMVIFDGIEWHDGMIIDAIACNCQNNYSIGFMSIIRVNSSS
jgi:hypothetical protein